MERGEWPLNDTNGIHSSVSQLWESKTTFMRRVQKPVPFPRAGTEVSTDGHRLKNRKRYTPRNQHTARRCPKPQKESSSGTVHATCSDDGHALSGAICAALHI